MTEHDAAVIARGLSALMRECMTTAEETFRGSMQIWAPHASTIKALHKRGLCSEPDYRDVAYLNDDGLAIRTELEKANG